MRGRTGRTVSGRRRAAILGGALFTLLVALPLGTSGAAAEPPPAADGPALVLDYYWAIGCHHCDSHGVMLDALSARYADLEVRRYEVRRDAAHRERLRGVLEQHGVTQAGVPVTVIEDRLWVGHNERVVDEIERVVAARLDPLAEPAPEAKGDGFISLPLFGDVDVNTHSLLGATLLIAFADGFNPCSLWVLTVLLAMIVRTGSRRRIAAVGLTFLGVTAAVYGLFIVGLFTVLGYLEMATWVHLLVALLAFAFGAVNVKDYFAYKWGLSFTIPDRFKPAIMRRSGKLRSTRRSLAAVLGMTALMALGVSLVELPCTAGFPVVWTALLQANEVTGGGFALLLAAYLLVYLGVEIAILVVVLVTMRLGRFEETHGRALKLIGGMIMLALAGILVIDPAVMSDIVGSFIVVGSAVAAAFLIMAVDRLVRARLGREPPQDGAGEAGEAPG